MKTLLTILIVALSLSAPAMAEVKPWFPGKVIESDRPAKKDTKPANQPNEMENWKFNNGTGIASTKADTLFYAKWDHKYGVYFTTTSIMDCKRTSRSKIIAKINGQPVKFIYGCMGYGVYSAESSKGREFVNNAFKKSSTVRVQDMYFLNDDVTFSAIGFMKAIQKAGEADRKAKAYEKSAL